MKIFTNPKIKISRVYEHLMLIAAFNNLKLSKAKDYSQAVSIFKSQLN